MSKKGKIVVGVSLALMICIIGIICVERYNRDSGTGEFNVSEITANELGECGGNVSVEVKEGEKLVIKSYLEKGKIRITLGKEEKAQTGNESYEELLDLMDGKDIVQIVEGHNTYEFEVPAGKYSGSANILEKTTGRVKLTSEKK